MSGYTTNEVAELIGIAPHQVRHYARRQLVAPTLGERGEFRFTFQDVVLLRTAKRLLDAQLSSRQTFAALLKVKGELNQQKNLSSVRIFADGNTVMVRDDEHLWEVETGQAQLDFAVPQAADNVADLQSPPTPPFLQEPEDMDSDDWYNLGLDLEEVDPDRAPDAYRQAIRKDPKNADAQVNLGRLYQLQGDIKRAKRHYELALTAQPAHQLANYNLGTLFDELSETEKALEYYLKATAVPDAHYNLARIFELGGDELSALRHMRTYREMLDESHG